MYKRISVVDDNKEVHEAVKEEIGAEAEIELVSCHTSGKEALSSLLRLGPDAVLMDIRMPGISGIKVAQRLKLLRPSLAIVMFSGATDRHSVFSSLAAGADGYVVKGDSRIREVVQELSEGGAPFSKTIRPVIREAFRACRCEIALSDREREIFEFVIRGYRDKEIAHVLELELRTVESYVGQVRRKFGVKSRKELRRQFLGSEDGRIE